MKKNRTICIIDDEEIIHFIVKTIIKKLDSDIKFLSYNNGEEALIALKQMQESNDEIPDIIFVDINMPVMDGWQFLDKFKTIKPLLDKKISIYILSSSDAEEDISKSKSYADVSGYLSKPIEIEMLRKIIQLEFSK
jgi:CheY-like chemotaxis protein